MDVPGAIKTAVSGGAGRLGLDLVRHKSLRHPVGRRIRLINGLGVDLVIDVGANEGQYARELRTFGYDGLIISLEPLAKPYAILEAAARRDPKWRVVQSAAGAADEDVDMFVAANRGASSSLLPMLPLHEVNAPHARIVGQEQVQVRRLDGLLSNQVEAAARPFLKMDVQGYEAFVLEGAEGMLPRIVGLQIELQLVGLYDRAPTFERMLERIADLGFDLAGLEPGFVSQDGRLLATDGLFVKRERGVES